MIYFCPRAFSKDCNAEKCSLYDSGRCIEGQMGAAITGKPSGQVVSCPRAFSANCSKNRCMLWGTSKCVDGRVNIHFEH